MVSATLWAYACGDGTTEPAAPDPLLPTTVTVSPATATVVEGDTLRLTATATNVYGQAVTGVEFVWASGDSAVAVVDASGLVTGVAAGQVQVTATAAGLTGRAELAVVTPLPTTVAVTPDTVMLTAVGQTAQLTAEVRDQAGRVMDGVPVAWLSADTAVAVVNESGLVTAVGSGAVIVTATAGEASGDALVTVAINPDRGALVALYNATDGPNWVNNENWLTDAPLGEWYGVDTDAAGRIVGIDLAGQWDNETRVYIPHGLRGELPIELANLTELTTLRLRANSLSGPIPPKLGNLASLKRLELSHNSLSGPIPPQLDELAELRVLYLNNNSITGRIPPELGSLAELTLLNLSRNQLSGPIPQSFLQLDQLRRLYVGGQDVCVPGASAFVAWFVGIGEHDREAGIFCNAADVAALKSLYRGTGGAYWNESGGWSGDDPVEEWHGVTADSLGHVTELALEGNGLTGRLPSTLGDMLRMTVLRIADNALSGRLPRSLTALPLVEFRYSETELCVPAEASFQDWLNAIASLEGTGVNCAPASSDRDFLEIFYNATRGSNWARNDNWLTDAPLRDWYGVEVNGEGRVSALVLTHNNLSGRVPPEVGNLTELERLNLDSYDVLGRAYNNLAGPIPPELGNLARLRVLNLHRNDLTGPIPPELGNLANLMGLDLRYNNLTGPIPPELGNLAKLNGLGVEGNNLTGPIPPELGKLANLRSLSLGSNDLSGSFPPELGALTRLGRLTLARNPGLAGALPQSATGLPLYELQAGGTGLCAPGEADFQAWLGGMDKHWIAQCATDGLPPAYLTQAVQSREFPVPLVASERALLRVFPTARQTTSEGIPLVRARFYVGGRETHVQDIGGKSSPIPTAVEEGSLPRSANAEIAAWVIQPGLEMVIEVDPDSVLDPEMEVAKRIPETGRLAVDVKAMPPFDLMLIPFVWIETHDSSIVDLVEAMAADPEHHEMLGDTRTLLPIGALAVTAHKPVLSSSNNSHTLFNQTQAIRVMEGGTEYYMGMMSSPVRNNPGLAGGMRSTFAVPSPSIIGHELGHNLTLAHAPCGSPSFLDPSYPYPDGSIGAWGYDFRDGGRLVSPFTPDLMSYCRRDQWISDYHFTNALRYRLVAEGSAAVAAVSASARSLLLWGGVGADSVPYLEPAFVVDAPAALPDSAGEYRITGRTAGGSELFSLSFTMPVTADGDGSSSFAFALPVRAGWEDSLATITLDGPAGSVTLAGESDIPMAILRDLRTGQVRGILRDPPLAAEVAADAVGASAPDLEVLFSRGIPGAAGWRR